jgi:opacity protein-like surface antigen
MKSKVKYGLMAIGSAVLGAILFTTYAAKAQTSVYVGVHGGQSMASTELSAAPGISLDGLGSKGAIGGIHGGLDFQFPSSVVFIGAFAGYDWQNTEFAIAFGPASITATLGDSWYIGGRAGVVVHGAKLYGLAAWRQTEWSTSLPVPGLALDDPRGWDVGIGIDVPISKGVVLGVEGVRTQYQKAEFSAGAPAAPTGIHAQTDQISVMARLSFALGGNPASIFDDAAPAKASKTCDPKTGCK